MSRKSIEQANFILAGVGGQGTVLASDILAQVGLASGLDVKQSEVHGMAQRGGSVISQVRWGQKVYSPLISKGEADYLLAFELLEAVRYVDFLKRGAVLITSDQKVPPVSVAFQGAVYPDDAAVHAVFHQVTDRVFVIPALKTAEAAGSARAANVVLLGALAAVLGIAPDLWLQVIDSRVPERFRQLNRKAFESGRSLVRK